MSLRDSLDLIRMVRPDAGHAAIQHEINAERATSLGAAEAKVKATLAAWRAENTPIKLEAARKAVWGYFVQRELIGFRRHADVIADLGIPPVVLNGLGDPPPMWRRRR